MSYVQQQDSTQSEENPTLYTKEQTSIKNIHRVIDVPLDLIEHNAFRLMPVKRRKEKSKRSFRAELGSLHVESPSPPIMLLR